MEEHLCHPAWLWETKPLVLKVGARVNRSQTVSSHGGVNYCAVGDMVYSSSSTRKIQAAIATQVTVPGTALAASWGLQISSPKHVAPSIAWPIMILLTLPAPAVPLVHVFVFSFPFLSAKNDFEIFCHFLLYGENLVGVSLGITFSHLQKSPSSLSLPVSQSFYQGKFNSL